MNIPYEEFIKYPEIVIHLYEQGYFPMAHEEQVDWYSPEQRGVIRLDEFHASRSLHKFMRNKQDFEIKTDRDFEKVMRACAEPSEGRTGTWINEDLIRVFCKLHKMGFAHSVECWRGDELVGGLYGLHIGAVFCGESMFSRTPNASKVALYYLVEYMKRGGFSLLDAQFTNAHLEQFGITEMPREEYIKILEAGLNQSAQWVPI
jgi:leucyl/phenylalanyl-tRNA---protein transferase